MSADASKKDVRISARLIRASIGALSATAIAVAMFVAVDLMPPSTATKSFAYALMLLAPAVATAFDVIASRRTEGPESTFWKAAALGTASLLVGEACDLLWRMNPSGIGSFALSIQVLAFLSAAVFGAQAAQWVVEGDVIGGDRRGYVLDVLVILLAVFVIVLAMTLPALRTNEHLGYVRGVMLALYPSLAIAIVVYTAVFRRAPWSSWQVLLISWMGILGVKHILAAFVPLSSRLVVPGWWTMLPLDALALLAYALGSAAAIERLSGVHTTTRSRERPAGLIWPALAAPAILIVIAPFIYLRVSSAAWTQADVWVIVILGVALGLATTARAAIFAVENTTLRRRSVSDQLTGLYNHRHFHERLDAEIVRASRTGGFLSIVSMDVDDFDRVNNVYGHATGDQRLKSIADRIFSASRASDVVCRVGGDEFSIIMPGTDAVQACRFCLRLQDDLRMPDDACPSPSTLSMGIACLPEHARTREELVQRADGALYWAKFHGREQVVIYDAGLVRALGPDERITRLEEESYLAMVQLLSSAVDARDPNTQRHSARVAELSATLAHELGLCDTDVSLIETAALLHDVGKIGVPDAVLLKRENLTAEEFGFVREHPLLATRMLGAIPHREILPWIAAHHEHWDGGGYPAGLAGEDIPLPARIISLCDAFDGMTTACASRDRAMSTPEARVEIAASAGTLFDPTLVKRFDTILARLQAEPQTAAAQSE